MLNLELAQLRSIQRRLQLSIVLIFGLVASGAGGYVLVEGWDLFDGLYMTIITLAGVGYGETRPLSFNGRVFTIFLIIGGVFTLANLINQVALALAEGYFETTIQLRRRMKQLEKLNNHYIVCGYGRIGRQICRDFITNQLPFVVIEQDTDTYETAEQDQVLVLQGDASSDQLLQEAGISRARCLICALPSDAENLYLVLSAKTLNPQILTIARANTEEGIAKLTRVGADRVVSPYLTGARRMAALALRPQVVDFIETAFSGEGTSYFIEELLLDQRADSPAIGKTLKELDIRSKTGGLILAIRRASGVLLGSPSPNVDIEPGDLLICMGTSEQLQKVGLLLAPGKQIR